MRDCEGPVEVLSWELSSFDRLVLKLARPAKGELFVIGAPTANPLSNLPFDTHGFLPMLGFKLRVTSGSHSDSTHIH